MSVVGETEPDKMAPQPGDIGQHGLLAGYFHGTQHLVQLVPDPVRAVFGFGMVMTE